MTERELLEKIRNEPSEFRIIFNEYYKIIFNYVLRRTTDFDLTRDILSETFRKAFQNIRYFSYRGISIKVWIYRIATNEINLHFRHKKIADRYVDNYTTPDQLQFANYVEEDRKILEMELLKHEQFMRIVELLKKMPVKYQEVISLRFFESKNIPEISEILNKKVGTVKSLLSRGVEKLRKSCNDF